MGFLNSFQTFAAAQTAGQQINADLQAKRDEHELRQQQMEQSRFALQMQKQQMQQQQAFQQQAMQLLQSADADQKQAQVDAGLSPDEAAVQKLSREADQYRKLGQAALLTNPAMAQQYLNLAEQTQTRVTAQQKANQDIADKQAKSLASFAGNVLDGTATPQEAFDWVRQNYGLQAAMKIPSDPVKAMNYWKAQQREGMSAADQIRIRQEAQQAKEREQRAREEHEDREKDRRIQIQQLAESRNFNQQMARDRLALEKQKYEEGGAIQRRQTIAAVNYANEASRGLDLVATMGAKQTAGAFAHLESPTTVLRSLESTGTNKLTPEDQQIYQTASKGLGLELAQLATAGSGRAPVKDLINEMTQMVEARPGDTQLEIMFKLSNAADFAKTRLEAVPASPDPKIQAIREKAEASLARYPHPTQIIELAKKKKAPLQSQGRLMSLREKLDETAAGSDSSSSLPADVQSLLDKYK